MRRRNDPTRSPIWICGLLLGASALCGSAAWAAGATEAPDSSTGPTLQDLLQRIDNLERRNKALEGQVTELKALEGEKWLSQERADQIRSIVADVVSDSEQRASLRQDAMTAGWNDGFFLASPDGRFKLQVSGLIQPRFMWSHVRNYFQGFDPNTGQPLYSTPYVVPDTFTDRYGFDSNYNELCFKGHVFSPAVEFMVRTNVALNTSSWVGLQSTDYTGAPNLGSASGGLYLLDAWSRIAFSDNWSLRFGQYRSPYAREQLITEANQMAVNRSTVVRNYGLWYTQGIEFQYQGDDFRWNLSIDDGGSSLVAGTSLQLVGGQPLDAPWYSQQVSWSVTTRLEWKPFGAWQDFTSMTSAPGEQQGLLLGLAYHTQASRPFQTATAPAQFPNPPTTVGGPENYWDAVTVDAQWNFGGASLFMAGFWNYVNSQSTTVATFGTSQPLFGPDQLGIVNAYGVVIQPAIYFMPKWEWFTRYEYGYVAMNDAGALQGLTAAGGQPSALQGYAFQQPYSVITTGVNWYIDGQDLKWTTDVGFSMGDVGYSWQNLAAGWRVSGTDQVVVRTQLQLQF